MSIFMDICTDNIETITTISTDYIITICTDSFITIIIVLNIL